MKKYKVLVVDDSLTVRQALSEILVTDPELEVMATVSDPFAAAEKIAEEAPDVITLDIEMPNMDGLTFLRMIMALKPIPVVICSSKVDRPKNAMLALEYGAVDVVFKPQTNVRIFLHESTIMLCDAVKAAARAKLKRIDPHSERLKEGEPVGRVAAPVGTLPAPTPGIEKIVVIGASTGGTDALRTFLKGLPADSPGIVVVQHMPEHFTKGFAERLNASFPLAVKEAENNDRILRGHVLIAPGNRHMLLKRGGSGYFVEVKDGPLVSRHRPSVDVLFRSAARYAGADAIGIIMTGMGDDGAAGMREMKDAGAYTIAQDEASCTIFGMPNEAIKHGGVVTVLPLDEIARKVIEIVRVPDRHKEKR